MGRQQDHIHLSMTLGASPENAPDQKWAVTDRGHSSNVLLEARRALKGTLRIHALTEGGVPLQFHAYRYKVKVQGAGDRTIEQRMQDLSDMLGNQVYLCDVYHADDLTDHTSDVRLMGFVKMGAFNVFSPSLALYYVDIELEPVTGIVPA